MIQAIETKLVLSDVELATLREMRGYPQGYYFRQATCRKLVEKGLAVPTRADVKRRPHMITDAGLQILEDNPSP